MPVSDQSKVGVFRKIIMKPPSDKDSKEKQIRTVQQEVDYTVREYPIEVLVQKHVVGIDDGTNELFVPDYQRDLIWDDARQSKFIESLLIGLPVPYLFVADVGNENSDLAGRLEIIDGTQRIRTLARFIADELQLRDLGKLDALNGSKFSDLLPSRQRRFNRITLRMIELTEKAEEETRRDMFDRINTGPVKLNDMESRRGRMPGLFVDLIKDLAREPLFAELAPVSPSRERRYEREELVGRFFAFTDGYNLFGQTDAGKIVSDFVDEFTQLTNAKMAQDGPGGPIELDLRSRWKQMLEFVQSYFPNGFAKVAHATSTPRVRFEAISVGAALALAQSADPPGKGRVAEWLDAKEFRSLTTSDAANNRSRVLNRINFVRDKLLS
jgi:hypothetical protein